MIFNSQDNGEDKINDENVPGYLETYFFCEITHAVEFCFEFVGSIIAGCLIMIYSKETEETNLRLDPLTGI